MGFLLPTPLHPPPGAWVPLQVLPSRQALSRAFPALLLSGSNTFPEPPEARAQAELARLSRALVVPEFTDSTPLDLFDRDSGVISTAPRWTWEATRTIIIPRAHYSEHSDGVYIPSLDDVGGVICGSV